MDKVENNDNQRFRTFPLSMDKVGSKEEALLLVESYEAFIDIKERPNVGIWYIVFSFVFIIFIPIILLQVFPLGMWGDSDGTELCCGSILLGILMFFVGIIQIIAHRSGYKKAAQKLTHAAGIHEKISYPFFRLQTLVLQKYPFLHESRENSYKSKPRKVVVSQREKNDL